MEGDENTWGRRLLRWADVKEHPRPGPGMLRPPCPVRRPSSLGASGSHRAMAHTKAHLCVEVTPVVQPGLRCLELLPGCVSVWLVTQHVFRQSPRVPG